MVLNAIERPGTGEWGGTMPKGARTPQSAPDAPEQALRELFRMAAALPELAATEERLAQAVLMARARCEQADSLRWRGKPHGDLEALAGELRDATEQHAQAARALADHHRRAARLRAAMGGHHG